MNVLTWNTLFEYLSFVFPWLTAIVQHLRHRAFLVWYLRYSNWKGWDCIWGIIYIKIFFVTEQYHYNYQHNLLFPFNPLMPCSSVVPHILLLGASQCKEKRQASVGGDTKQISKKYEMDLQFEAPQVNIKSSNPFFFLYLKYFSDAFLFRVTKVTNSQNIKTCIKMFIWKQTN